MMPSRLDSEIEKIKKTEKKDKDFKCLKKLLS